MTCWTRLTRSVLLGISLTNRQPVNRRMQRSNRSTYALAKSGVYTQNRIVSEMAIFRQQSSGQNSTNLSLKLRNRANLPQQLYGGPSRRPLAPLSAVCGSKRSVFWFSNLVD